MEAGVVIENVTHGILPVFNPTATRKSDMKSIRCASIKPCLGQCGARSADKTHLRGGGRRSADDFCEFGNDVVTLAKATAAKQLVTIHHSRKTRTDNWYLAQAAMRPL